MFLNISLLFFLSADIQEILLVCYRLLSETTAATTTTTMTTTRRYTYSGTEKEDGKKGLINYIN